MRSAPGRIRRLLALRLQRDIPEINGLAVTWLPDNLYRRQGRHIRFCDAYAWSAAPVWAGTNVMASLVDCWYPMTECLRANRLSLENCELGINVPVSPAVI